MAEMQFIVTFSCILQLKK